jgi:hypothetical protein
VLGQQDRKREVLRKHKTTLIQESIKHVEDGNVSKLYIGRHATYVWALAIGPRLHRILTQVPRGSPNKYGDITYE